MTLLFRFASFLLLTAIARTAVAQPPVTALAVTPDANRLLAASSAGVWEHRLADLVRLREIRLPLPRVSQLTFSPAGDRVAFVGGVPGEEGSIAVLSWPDAKLLATHAGGEDWLTAVAWDSSGRTLLVGGHDGVCQLLSLEENGSRLQPTRRWDAHPQGVTGASFLPGDEQLATCGVDGVLRVWQADTGEAVRGLNNHQGPIHAMALRPGAGRLPLVTTVGADRTVRFWQPTIGRMVRFARLSWRPQAVVWSPDGKLAIVAGEDGRLAFVDPETAAVVAEARTSVRWIYCLACGSAPDAGDIVQAGGEQGRLVSQAVAAE
ncbi:WD40 repeat domain-containing protein [Lignipirellula cremea]|uniref:WD domain, G-beta repeat n=1 Tax=Lignipirellula cremea TaxID=2528010 RepID=A0A518DL77_9BACT|nr:hypothetical protein [Lignipirellula cremea]QDU92580.1 WD domain, G-beta repeat [Lignipirellula cremea]